MEEGGRRRVAASAAPHPLPTLLSQGALATNATDAAAAAVDAATAADYRGEVRPLARARDFAGETELAADAGAAAAAALAAARCVREGGRESLEYLGRGLGDCG